MALTDKLTAIGDAIREKNGTTKLIPLADMPQAILDIVGGGKEEQEKTITITENGTTEILPDENKALSKVTVVTDVSGGSDISVEYIESTGTQYIDTEYIANQNTRIKCKYQIVGSNGEYDTLFADFTNIQYSHRYAEPSRNTQLIKWGGQHTAYGSALSSSSITTLEVNNGTFTFNEGGNITTQVIGANTEFTSPYSILLFCNRYYKDVSQNEMATCCKARFYYFKIYEGEELVRDFVPAIDENGVVCLYDNVTKDYFYNQGSGEFEGKFVEKVETTSLNIAYGETAPEDTSKLWIKANEPKNVEFTNNLENGVESIKTLNAVLNTANCGTSCARVGNKIYIFGGDNSATIQVFDITTKTITTLTAQLPRQLSAMGISVVEDKIYLFGGYHPYNNSNNIYVFDTEQNTFTTISGITLPYRMFAMGCVTVGTNIYLFGGSYDTSFLNTIMVYDTINNQLTTISKTLPEAISGMGVALVENRVYLFSGITSGGRSNKIIVFDTTENSISELSRQLPIGIGGSSCYTVGNKIYLFGGETTGVVNTIYLFNTEDNTLTQLSTTLPIALRGTSASGIENKVYIFGGYGSSYTNGIYEFTITFSLTQGNIEIQSTLFNNTFNLINTDNTQVKIGVENVYIGNENNEAEPVDAYLHNGTEWVQI